MKISYHLCLQFYEWWDAARGEKPKLLSSLAYLRLLGFDAVGTHGNKPARNLHTLFYKIKTTSEILLLIPLQSTSTSAIPTENTTTNNIKNGNHHINKIFKQEIFHISHFFSPSNKTLSETHKTHKYQPQWSLVRLNPRRKSWPRSEFVHSGLVVSHYLRCHYCMVGEPMEWKKSIFNKLRNRYLWHTDTGYIHYPLWFCLNVIIFYK